MLQKRVLNDLPFWVIVDMNQESHADSHRESLTTNMVKNIFLQVFQTLLSTMSKYFFFHQSNHYKMFLKILSKKPLVCESYSHFACLLYLYLYIFFFYSKWLNWKSCDPEKFSRDPSGSRDQSFAHYWPTKVKYYRLILKAS